ncbi:putative amidohydrolase [Pseudarthrobacter siccitolerans]|uniref:Amidohydrolase n=1 Tax=Pseudarthrobacter siccitolerans TaxID=861266 RepID=A0ABU0PQ48_9MICC|nr:nitrilase-related carbon-nitrogen hydrolase [Pseudarthrobacter siccitolerans]MDQ0676088.1 putative amidohydrolase [Pseudarthrobacter siccitolerans]
MATSVSYVVVPVIGAVICAYLLFRLAFYRKIQLFDAQGFGESTFIKPGPSTDPVVFEHGGARFGLMTCYDLRFPELARSLADAGAQRSCWSARPGSRGSTRRSSGWL